MIKAQLLHLGYNLWSDVMPIFWKNHPTLELLKNRCAADHLRCSIETWRRVTRHMQMRGFNMAVIDLGEGVRYPSHPELAVRGSWSPDQLRAELARLRQMGIEPIPKLNFSTSHDTWLGDYGRMVSTPTYYRVCADLIADVAELFDSPRFFHIGYDEENHANQMQYAMAVIRHGELWWNDFFRIVREVERHGMRAWMWSDFYWHHPEEFVRRMPRSVLQSNWYYEGEFDLSRTWPTKYRLEAFAALDRAGFDQVPTSANSRAAGNAAGNVAHCRRAVAPERLKGHLMTTWRKLTPDFERVNIAATDLLADGLAANGYGAR